MVPYLINNMRTEVQNEWDASPQSQPEPDSHLCGFVCRCFFCLLPVYILLVTSLKSYAEVNLSTMWSLPKGISLDSFLRAWNGDPSKGTIGLSSNFMNSLKWNVQMAGAILAALPTLVIFIILGRYFLRGLLAGSLKG